MDAFGVKKVENHSMFFRSYLNFSFNLISYIFQIFVVVVFFF